MHRISTIRCCLFVIGGAVILYIITYAILTALHENRHKIAIPKYNRPIAGKTQQKSVIDVSARNIPRFHLLHENQRILQMYLTQRNKMQKKLKESRAFYTNKEACNGASLLNAHLNLTNPLKMPKHIPYLGSYDNPCFCDSKSVIRCLPKFFILAPQKSGTTDLYHALTNHPLIVQPVKKEPHWFDRSRFGIYNGYPKEDFLKYTDYFNQLVNQNKSATASSVLYPAITGDFSASTLYDQLLWKYIPENKGEDEPKITSAHLIRYLLPDAKFIVVLREPVSRFHSDWNFYKFIYEPHRRKSNHFDLHHKTTRAVDWMQTCLSSKEANRSCYYSLPFQGPVLPGWHPDLSWEPVVRLRAGLYSVLLRDWFNLFPRHNFYVTRLEDYSSNRSQILCEMFDFLGVECNRNVTSPRKVYNAHKKVPILTRTRALLQQFYKPYNEDLAKLLQDEKYLWQ